MDHYEKNMPENEFEVNSKRSMSVIFIQKLKTR